jgi:CubicO group peptidase (beta-lactamase class C family)
MSRAPDPVRYALEQPMTAEPGRIYVYSGGATALIAAVLRKASGQPLDVFANEALFEPLGIADVEWVRYRNGEPVAASGLRLRPRDLLKVGQLVLQEGAWNGRQIVPASIREMTSPQINGEGIFFYGYQWWLGRSLVGGREISWTAALGLGGQRLAVVPELGLVVAMTAGLYASPVQGSVLAQALNRYILPAAMNAKP